jgi:hypothetical protein
VANIVTGLADPGGFPALSEPPAMSDVFRDMLIEFYFTPELHLKDGRIIRDLEDAASFAREQEVSSGGSTSETR